MKAYCANVKHIHVHVINERWKEQKTFNKRNFRAFCSRPLSQANPEWSEQLHINSGFILQRVSQVCSPDARMETANPSVVQKVAVKLIQEVR